MLSPSLPASRCGAPGDDPVRVLPCGLGVPAVGDGGCPRAWGGRGSGVSVRLSRVSCPVRRPRGRDSVAVSAWQPGPWRTEAPGLAEGAGSARLAPPGARKRGRTQRRRAMPSARGAPGPRERPRQPGSASALGVWCGGRCVCGTAPGARDEDRGPAASGPGPRPHRPPHGPAAPGWRPRPGTAGGSGAPAARGR